MDTKEIQRHDSNGKCTREWIVGHASPESASEVKVERVKLYPQVAHAGPAWRWLYVYSADGGPAREYGTGLADARRYLKRVFPNAKVIETWK